MFSDKYMILSISFKHTTGDYSDVEHPLKPLEHISMKMQRYLHKMMHTCELKLAHLLLWSYFDTIT